MSERYLITGAQIGLIRVGDNHVLDDVFDRQFLGHSMRRVEKDVSMLCELVDKRSKKRVFPGTKEEAMTMTKKQVIEKDSSQDERKVMIDGLGDVTVYEKWYDPEYCKLAVQEDGLALRFVKMQTEEVCRLAVQEDGLALQYVRVQTEEVCRLAVQEGGNALRYVDKRVFKNMKDE